MRFVLCPQLAEPYAPEDTIEPLGVRGHMVDAVLLLDLDEYASVQHVVSPRPELVLSMYVFKSPDPVGHGGTLRLSVSDIERHVHKGLSRSLDERSPGLGRQREGSVEHEKEEHEQVAQKAVPHGPPPLPALERDAFAGPVSATAS